MIITKKHSKFVIKENDGTEVYKDKKCNHDRLYNSDFKLSDAGNLVVVRKCVYCDKVIDNFIFRPDVVEHNDGYKWNKLKG